MGSQFSPAKIQRMKDEAHKDIKEAFYELQRDFPDAVAAGGIAILAGGPLGLVTYIIAKKRRNARLVAALGRAIEKLYKIQERLMANAEYFREELAKIKACIDQFEHQRP